MKYRIGSINMKNWSANERNDSRKDFEKIAQIIYEEKMDVVGLQEILSEGKGVKKLVESELYGWDAYSDQPRDSGNLDIAEETKDRRGEGYAYLWNKREFKLMEKVGKEEVFEPRIISRNDVREIDPSAFARAPYYIRLQPLFGGFFELRLINIHIRFKGDISARKNEFETLVKCVYPTISQNRYGQNRVAYTIAMGDYNLNIFNPNVQTQTKNCYLTEVYSYSEGTKNIHVHTVQDQLTTLKQLEDGFANNFDHFTYSQELSGFVKVSFEVVDAVNKYCGGDFFYYNKHISDHLPIVMTIEI